MQYETSLHSGTDPHSELDTTCPQLSSVRKKTPWRRTLLYLSLKLLRALLRSPAACLALHWFSSFVHRFFSSVSCVQPNQTISITGMQSSHQCDGDLRSIEKTRSAAILGAVCEVMCRQITLKNAATTPNSILKCSGSGIINPDPVRLTISGPNNTPNQPHGAKITTKSQQIILMLCHKNRKNSYKKVAYVSCVKGTCMNFHERFLCGIELRSIHRLVAWYIYRKPWARNVPQVQVFVQVCSACPVCFLARLFYDHFVAYKCYRCDQRRSGHRLTKELTPCAPGSSLPTLSRREWPSRNAGADASLMAADR